MPTYEYRCDACGHELEEFQSITAKPLRSCPKCRKPKLKRLIGTGAGIIFKGSGFYETDYRSESYKKAAKAEKDSTSPKTETKSEAKSETKPSTETKSTPAKTSGGDAKPAKKSDAKKSA